MPIMQIHGTADPTVPYAGNASMMGIENVVTYWRDFNNCDVTPEFTAVPDINATDLCTAERYVYVNGNSGSTVEFFKIINGAHTWPGAPITIGVTNQDINASAEIWRFFSQYSIDNLVSLEDYNLEDSFSIYPNPSIEKFTVATTEIVDFIQVSDLQGRMIQKIRPSGQQTEIELQSAGAYFITIFHGQNQVTKRIVMD
jgi:polyhydroxybutyrate depolymerase